MLSSLDSFQAMAYPEIIQGGMGAGVSNWRLANAVARLGQLGVVSGTALDTILIRRLQDGDTGGHMRRAMAAFLTRESLNRSSINGSSKVAYRRRRLTD